MGCAFLKFSNKRHSHLFEKDCTQNGPRFLTEKLARFA